MMDVESEVAREADPEGPWHCAHELLIATAFQLTGMVTRDDEYEQIRLLDKLWSHIERGHVDPWVLWWTVYHSLPYDPRPEGRDAGPAPNHGLATGLKKKREQAEVLRALAAELQLPDTRGARLMAFFEAMAELQTGGMFRQAVHEGALLSQLPLDELREVQSAVRLSKIQPNALPKFPGPAEPVWSNVAAHMDYLGSVCEQRDEDASWAAARVLAIGQKALRLATTDRERAYTHCIMAYCRLPLDDPVGALRLCDTARVECPDYYWPYWLGFKSAVAGMLQYEDTEWSAYWDIAEGWARWLLHFAGDVQRELSEASEDVRSTFNDLLEAMTGRRLS